MRYLLDVNALVALGFLQHEFHERTARWVRALVRENTAKLVTCAITELGFVRVLVQAQQYGLNVHQARQLLTELKSADTLRFGFVADDHGISQLPRWVRTAKQLTDGHLTGLAKSRGAILATLDRRIPGAFLIPH